MLSSAPMKFSLLVFWLIAAWLACAPVLAGTPVLLDERAGALRPHGQLQWRLDPQAAWSPVDAAAAGDWRALPGASLQAGFTSAAVWLRFSLHRAPGAAPAWVLRLSNALLDDVRLYCADGHGGWQEWRSGENLPRARWALDYRSPVLPLALDGEGPQEFLLRLQSKNALAVGIEFWPRQAFDDFSRREAYFYGLYFGVYLLLIVMHAGIWRMTRVPESGWYFAYVTVTVTFEGMSVGLPQQLLRLPVSWSDPLLGLSMALALPVGAIFAARQLGLHALYPRAQRRYTALSALLGGFAALAVLLDRYALGAQTMQLSALAAIPLVLGLGAWLLWRGHRPARFFLLAFGVFYAGAIVSFLRNLGVVPANFWTEHAAALGTLIHMGMMSLSINVHYRRLKAEKAQAQAALVEAALAHSQQLEQRVAERTAELFAQVQRREALEQELRAALAVERGIREEQREFVAMVSHEFRTPLAIINTSAQQIARNLDAAPERTLRRCQNIRDGAARLLALVDDYLTQDRMEAGQAHLRCAPFAVREWLDGLAAEWPAGRLRVDLGALPATLSGDLGLLSIAVRNLLINADRHTAAELCIRLEAQTGAAGGLCLRVANPAPAIPPEDAAQLFQKYYRGRQAQWRSGAGLGLYLVRRIARLHGGEACLERRGVEGEVVFRIEVPVQPPSAAAAAALSAPADTPA